MKLYVEKNFEELLQLIRDLCKIPAPSHFEMARAEFCADWLKNIGAEGVYIDEAYNTVYPYNCENSDKITVIAAHLDTVFPDTEPMPFSEDEKFMRCPGIGDDTTSVAVLLYTVKYFLENNIKPNDGILFVCNSCEEGLGNLKGARQILSDYNGRIKQFVSFDSVLNVIHHTCVGSHRYEVSVYTEGGHSFNKFGRKNAIAVLSEIISKIYSIKVPQFENTVTTYNVGTINGGTSVNSIAQNCKMLCEYRSNDRRCLEIMKSKFADIFEKAKSDEVRVEVDLIGDRPCAGDFDKDAQDNLINLCASIVEEVIEKPVQLREASTDCNIPLSMGIPALCIGVFYGAGEHTREEYIEKDSIKQGLEVAIKTALAITEG